MDEIPSYFLAFVLAALCISVVSLASVPTGMLVKPVDYSGAYVGIANFTRGEIWWLNYSYSVKEYTPTIISCGFMNVGSITVMERMEMDIESLNMTPLLSFYDGFFTVSPGNVQKFHINYTPVLDPGYYLIHVNSSYATNKVANAWGIFQVIPLYETPVQPQPPATPETVPAGSFKVPETGFPAANLVYDSSVTLKPGQTYILPITVDNKGTASMYNNMFSARGDGIVFSASPMFIAKISAGSTGLFLLTISVPANAEPGSYKIGFTVTSDEVSKTGSVTVNVVSDESENYIGDMITNYMSIYITTKQRLMTIASEGKNVSDALSELELGHDDILKAKTSYDRKEYGDARTLLDSAKTHIGNALMIAEYSAIPEMRVSLPGYLSILIIVVILAMLSAFFLLIGARKKRKRVSIEKERLKSGG